MKTYRFLNIKNDWVGVIDEDGLVRVQTTPERVPDGAVIEPYTPPTQAEIDAAQQAELDALNGKVMDTDIALKAFALIVLDEINALRTNAGLAERTPLQLKTAHRTKLDTL